MKLTRPKLQSVALLGATLCFCTASQAQQGPAASDPTAASTDEIIVSGKALEELRIRIERAEDDIYARFNEINGNDAYDIHCYDRVPKDSHISRRVCLSNAARAADVTMSEATVRALQSAVGSSGAPSGATGIAQVQRAKQLDTERRVQDELRRLTQEDPVLKANVIRLGDAYRARDVMTGVQPGATLYSEVEAGGKELPFEAQHLFEVRVGDVAWRHALTSRTFTLGNVQGRIRELQLACDQTAPKTLDYKADAEWTVPESWGACTLEVSAKRNTTFALYEFD